jgi:hypothetical protein
VDCVNHPGVPGIGICVSCRRVLCDPCSTRLQGRNFCSRCMDLRGAGLRMPPSRPAGSAPRVAIVLLVALSFVSLVGLAWLGGFLLYLSG